MITIFDCSDYKKKKMMATQALEHFRFRTFLSSRVRLNPRPSKRVFIGSKTAQVPELVRR